MQTPETLLNRGGQDGCQRILIVDDEQVIRDVVAETLVAEGYRVFAAADGADALGVVDRSGPFALILLDMRMPGMDGWTFAERYRHLPGPHAPVLVFTAGSAGDAADWVERIGAAGVLHKPFDLDELVAAVTARVGCPPEPVHVCRPRDARRFSQTGPADPTTALRAVGPRPTQLPQPALAGAAAPQERTP